MNPEEIDDLRADVSRGDRAKRELAITTEIIAAKRAEAIDQLLRPENRDNRESIITLINVLDSLTKWLGQVVEAGEGAENLIEMILEQKQENV